MDKNDEIWEKVNDVLGDGTSSCCDAKVYNPSGRLGTGEAICMRCYEHCDEIEEED